MLLVFIIKILLKVKKLFVILILLFIGNDIAFAKIYKVDNEYIIITENSIYLVSSDIDTKRIS